MGQNSDHPSLNTGGGRDWVASIVNAIGESACRDADGRNYWETTATLIVGRLGRIARSRSTADSASASGGLSVWFRVPFPLQIPTTETICRHKKDGSGCQCSRQRQTTPLKPEPERGILRLRSTALCTVLLTLRCSDETGVDRGGAEETD